jgi:hypothetical protein
MQITRFPNSQLKNTEGISAHGMMPGITRLPEPRSAPVTLLRKMPKITNPQIPCAPEGWIGIEYPESNERDELLPEICKRPVQTRILEDPDQDPGPDIAACKGSTSSVQTEPHASNDHQDNCCVENRNARCYRVRKYELFGNRHITTDEKEN